LARTEGLFWTEAFLKFWGPQEDRHLGKKKKFIEIVFCFCFCFKLWLKQKEFKINSWRFKCSLIEISQNAIWW
jgi:hypothetical protein